MKKVLFFAAACLTMMACGNKAQSEQASDSLSAPAGDSLVFEGQFPNADGGETAAKLVLAQDSTMGCVFTQDTSVATGKYEAIAAGEVKGYKVTLGDNDVRYFAQQGDSVLSLTADSTLQPAASGMKYDLKRK